MATISQRISRRRGLHWLVTVPVLAACSGPDANSPAQTRTPVAAGTLRSVAVVTHSHPSDAFWSVVKNATLAAGKQLGIRVDYHSLEAEPSSPLIYIDD